LDAAVTVGRATATSIRRRGARQDCREPPLHAARRFVARGAAADALVRLARSRYSPRPPNAGQLLSKTLLSSSGVADGAGWGRSADRSGIAHRGGCSDRKWPSVDEQTSAASETAITLGTSLRAVREKRRAPVTRRGHHSRGLSKRRLFVKRGRQSFWRPSRERTTNWRPAWQAELASPLRHGIASQRVGPTIPHGRPMHPALRARNFLSPPISASDDRAGRFAILAKTSPRGAV